MARQGQQTDAVDGRSSRELAQLHAGGRCVGTASLPRRAERLRNPTCWMFSASSRHRLGRRRLQEAVRKRGGVSKLRSLAARRYPDVVVRVTSGTMRTAAWTYELRFNQDNRQRPLVKREWVAKAGETIIERPDDKDGSDPERLTQTYLEQVNANQQFRDVSDFLADHSLPAHCPATRARARSLGGPEQRSLRWRLSGANRRAPVRRRRRRGCAESATR